MRQSFDGIYNPSKNRVGVTSSFAQLKSVSAYKTSGSENFSDEYQYDVDGYKGVLTKDGDSRLISGSYVPTTYKTVTHSVVRVYSSADYYNLTDEIIINNAGGQTYYYNQDGYSGTLYYDHYTINNNGSSYVVEVYYTGTVKKPGYDSRVYLQNYKGIVYLGGQKIKYRRNLLC